MSVLPVQTWTGGTRTCVILWYPGDRRRSSQVACVGFFLEIRRLTGTFPKKHVDMKVSRRRYVVDMNDDL